MQLVLCRMVRGLKVVVSKLTEAQAMPGKDCKDMDQGLTNAAALYGWVILQIGDAVEPDPLPRGGVKERNILCNGKPAMTLAQNADSDHARILYIALPITPVELAKRLAFEERWARSLDDIGAHIAPSTRKTIWA
jgi:hypothetical protein